VVCAVRYLGLCAIFLVGGLFMKKKIERGRDYLVWIDCEMTGLDPEENVLIEIAVLITDSNLSVLAEGPVLAISQSEAELAKMDRWNRRTHGKSGLIDRVRNEGVSLAEAEKEVLKFVRKYCYVRTAPLCGNSIGQDKRFLAKYMPRLNDFFHYQIIDVSTIKQLVLRWYGKKHRAPAKMELHQAMPDIRESVAELAYYRKHVFRK
jgi:oligoribonuclease